MNFDQVDQAMLLPIANIRLAKYGKDTQCQVSLPLCAVETDDSIYSRGYPRRWRGMRESPHKIKNKEWAYLVSTHDGRAVSRNSILMSKN